MNFRILIKKGIQFSYGRPFSSIAVKEKWDLMSAVSLERKPVITRDLSELETKILKVMAEVENERSYKSNFELRLESDAKRAEDIKSGKNIDLDGIPQQTGQDFLDSCTEELKSFKFAPRWTKEEGNARSTNRCLDRHLLLLINEKVGKEDKWMLPQGTRQGEETMRECAERVLKEKCGESLEVLFYGNAPCGFYKYKYPKVCRDKSIGAKIFFFKAQIIKGEITLNKNHCKDYHWATRNELGKLQEDYAKSVRMFLIDEEH